MATPTFDSFSLQDSNYITEEINYRTTPTRSLDMEKIARRPGQKLMAHDFAERKVTLTGHILGSSASDLKDKIDALHTNVTRKDQGLLYIDSDRYSTATAVSVAITDPHYAQDYVPFSIDFLLADPFFYGTQQLVLYTIASGTTSRTDTITISGSVFAEPQIKFTANGTTGVTTTSGIIISYGPTAETITWSGTNGVPSLPYGTSVTFDYNNDLILQSSSSVEVNGVFSRWEPGATSYTVTFSGGTQGGSLQFIYQPRYL